MASITTKTVKDGGGGNVTMVWVDDGTGKLIPGHILLTAAGTAILSPATEGKQDALAALVATAARQDTLAALVATAARQDALAALVGEVGASPTTNTLLDRLKVIAANVAATTSALGAVVLSAGTAVIGKVDHTTTGIGHGAKTVTTAGTDVALATTTPAKWVEIQARTTNTGWIALGAAGVDATIGSGSGVLLGAGESRTFPCDDLADIFVDATVSGEGVRYTYGT